MQSLKALEGIPDDKPVIVPAADLVELGIQPTNPKTIHYTDGATPPQSTEYARISAGDLRRAIEAKNRPEQPPSE